MLGFLLIFVENRLGQISQPLSLFLPFFFKHFIVIFLFVLNLSSPNTNKHATILPPAFHFLTPIHFLSLKLSQLFFVSYSSLFLLYTFKIQTLTRHGEFVLYYLSHHVCVGNMGQISCQNIQKFDFCILETNSDIKKGCIFLHELAVKWQAVY